MLFLGASISNNDWDRVGLGSGLGQRKGGINDGHKCFNNEIPTRPEG